MTFPSQVRANDGDVILFKDDSLTSTYYTFNIRNMVPSKIDLLTGSPLQDKATGVRYNLKPGIVMTLANSVAYPQLPDLSGLGRTIDLIGDGQEHTLDLRTIGCNDIISAFFFRTVDLSQGYLVFYDDANYSGPRQYVFLSEWPTNTVVNISKWHVQDLMSSVQWCNIVDSVYVEVYQNSDASGRTYSNILRTQPLGTVEGLPSLASLGVGDQISAFKICLPAPVKEVIDTFQTDVQGTDSPSQAVLVNTSGNNPNADAGHFMASFSEQVTETTSVTTTQTHQVGGSLTYTYTWTASVAAGGIATAKTTHSLALNLHYDYTNTQSSTSQNSKSINVSISQDYPIPPRSSYVFTMLAQLQTVNIAFKTNTTRWYTQPLYGTVPDGGLFKRNEVIKGTFNGAMYLLNVNTFVTTPL